MTQVKIVDGHVIDQHTGEQLDLVPYQEPEDVYLSSALDELAGQIESGHTPMYITKAQELSVPDSVISDYLGVESEKLEDHVGHVYTIKGAIIWYSGNYSPKDGNGDMERGYNTLLMLTTTSRKIAVMDGDNSVTVEVPLVLRTSSKHIAAVMLPLMQKYGWYNWERPVRIMFSGTNSKGFHARILEQEQVFSKVKVTQEK